MIATVRIVTLVCLALSAAAAFAQEVATPTVEVTDTYHGVTVHDPYRWLEDASAPAVQTWTREQNARTRAHLDAVASREAIKARLSALVTRGSPSVYSFKARGERIFAMAND